MNKTRLNLEHGSIAARQIWREASTSATEWSAARVQSFIKIVSVQNWDVVDEELEQEHAEVETLGKPEVHLLERCQGLLETHNGPVGKPGKEPGEYSRVYLVRISDLAEERASVIFGVGFGDAQEYTGCFLTLGTSNGREMVSPSSKVDSWILLFEKPGDHTPGYLSKVAEE